ncbi:hypothetical protein GQ42DRAFT_163909 [Ramicandelaber brevisporus]|nr:hypothetical protein GQ42DRAFT_163909 [Ramicandelaber brevisporus]
MSLADQQYGHVHPRSGETASISTTSRSAYGYNRQQPHHQEPNEPIVMDEQHVVIGGFRRSGGYASIGHEILGINNDDDLIVVGEGYQNAGNEEMAFIDGDEYDEDMISQPHGVTVTGTSSRSGSYDPTVVGGGGGMDDMDMSDENVIQQIGDEPGLYDYDDEMMAGDYVEEDEEEGTDTGASNEISWISWFCSLPGHEYFVEVQEEFIDDDFNLTGLNTMVPYYEEALEMILDVEDDEDDDYSSRTPNEIAKIESCAELLYGLIHARYILTKQGLQQMYDKYVNGQLGACPRHLCNQTNTLPFGLYDTPNTNGGSVKLFCPSCLDAYYPPSTRFQAIDGAFFGSTFPHLFLMNYPEFYPDRDVVHTAANNLYNSQEEVVVWRDGISNNGDWKDVYIPRIFGFKVSELAETGPRMQWLRVKPCLLEYTDEEDEEDDDDEEEEDEYSDNGEVDFIEHAEDADGQSLQQNADMMVESDMDNTHNDVVEHHRSSRSSLSPEVETGRSIDPSVKSVPVLSDNELNANNEDDDGQSITLKSQPEDEDYENNDINNNSRNDDIHR